MVITIGCVARDERFFREVQDVASFPKDNSVVGNKVNLVLDPTEIPFFRVTVNKTALSGRRYFAGSSCLQGLALAPGI